MATLVAIEGWGEGADVDALSYPSFVPSRFPREDLDVVFAEVKMSPLLQQCNLHHEGISCFSRVSLARPFKPTI